MVVFGLEVLRDCDSALAGKAFTLSRNDRPVTPSIGRFDAGLDEKRQYTAPSATDAVKLQLGPSKRMRPPHSLAHLDSGQNAGIVDTQALAMVARRAWLSLQGCNRHLGDLGHPLFESAVAVGAAGVCRSLCDF